jgi:hypothetical protein
MRDADSLSDNMWLVLSEPLCWVIVGVAALLGVMWQAVMALGFGLIFGGPMLVVLLYLRGLKQATFLCGICAREASFSEARQPRG